MGYDIKKELFIIEKKECERASERKKRKKEKIA